MKLCFKVKKALMLGGCEFDKTNIMLHSLKALSIYFTSSKANNLLRPVILENL